LVKKPNTGVYCARRGKKLVGYAIAQRNPLPGNGKAVAWVTQLVVHADFRHFGIAKSLLHSIWGFSDDYAWGLVSANPYAVRALEKATRRRCDPVAIQKNLGVLLALAREHIPYIDKDPELMVDTETAKINTTFYVDHSALDIMISHVTGADVPWTLGSVDEGWEWIAFTFYHQPQISLSQEDLQQMLAVSDRVVKSAYNRMVLSSEQAWLGKTIEETEFIVRECGLHAGSHVIDFGCGNGRHAITLAGKGIFVTGIDYSASHINNAIKKCASDNVSFQVADCRDVDLGKNTADAVLCLYDVIGSYVDNAENQRILDSLYRHLKPGGTAMISVMNYDATLALAKNTFSLVSSPNVLLSLPASDTMERTGNIFDPAYFAVDTDEQIVYRKEQFTHGSDLPVELLVRDRRFTQTEIVTMCERAGFSVCFSRPVKLGDWERSAPEGKEILVKCQKPLPAVGCLF